MLPTFCAFTHRGGELCFTGLSVLILSVNKVPFRIGRHRWVDLIVPLFRSRSEYNRCCHIASLYISTVSWWTRYAHWYNTTSGPCIPWRCTWRGNDTMFCKNPPHLQIKNKMAEGLLWNEPLQNMNQLQNEFLSRIQDAGYFVRRAIAKWESTEKWLFKQNPRCWGTLLEKPLQNENQLQNDSFSRIQHNTCQLQSCQECWFASLTNKVFVRALPYKFHHTHQTEECSNETHPRSADNSIGAYASRNYTDWRIFWNLILRNLTATTGKWRFKIDCCVVRNILCLMCLVRVPARFFKGSKSMWLVVQRRWLTFGTEKTTWCESPTSPTKENGKFAPEHAVLVVWVTLQN